MSKKANLQKKIITYTKTVFAVSIGVLIGLSLLNYFDFILWTDFIGFLIAYVAGLLGILFGLLLDEASERDKEKQTIDTFLELIYKELSQIRRRQTDDT